jgi:hypothetical protein
MDLKEVGTLKKNKFSKTIKKIKQFNKIIGKEKVLQND